MIDELLSNYRHQMEVLETKKHHNVGSTPLGKHTAYVNVVHDLESMRKEVENQ